MCLDYNEAWEAHYFSESCRFKSAEEIQLRISENPKICNINGYDLFYIGDDTLGRQYCTPLESAILGNNKSVVKLLLDMGVYTNIKIYSDNILTAACRYGSSEIVKVLIPFENRKKKLIKAFRIGACYGGNDIVQYFFDTFGYDNKTFTKNYEIFLEAFHDVCCRPLNNNEYVTIRLFIDNIDNKKLHYNEGFFEGL